MKKMSIFVTAAALLLAGCSSTTSNSSIGTKISDDKTVITVDGINISKQDIFESFLSTYGPDQILNESLQKIAESELGEADLAEVEAKIQQQIATYEESFSKNASGQTFAQYVTESLGYESVEDYATKVIRPNIVQAQLLYKYIDTNYDQVLNEYGFTYIKTFTVETESDAYKIINSIDANEATIEEAATKAGIEKAPEQVLISKVYTGSAVDSEIIKLATTFTKEGMFSAPVKTSDSKYAVVQIVSKDMSQAKDAVRSQLTSNNDFAVAAEASFLKAHHFEVFESTLKDGIDSISDQYLKTETEEK